MLKHSKIQIFQCLFDVLKKTMHIYSKFLKPATRNWSEILLLTKKYGCSFYYKSDKEIDSNTPRKSVYYVETTLQFVKPGKPLPP